MQVLLQLRGIAQQAGVGLAVEVAGADRRGAVVQCQAAGLLGESLAAQQLYGMACVLGAVAILGTARARR